MFMNDSYILRIQSRLRPIHGLPDDYLGNRVISPHERSMNDKGFAWKGNYPLHTHGDRSYLDGIIAAESGGGYKLQITSHAFDYHGNPFPHMVALYRKPQPNENP